MCLPPLPARCFIFLWTLSMVYTTWAASCEDTDFPRDPEDPGRNSNIGSYSAGRDTEGPGLMPHYARPAPPRGLDPAVVLGPTPLSIPLHGSSPASPCNTHWRTFLPTHGYPPLIAAYHAPPNNLGVEPWLDASDPPNLLGIAAKTPVHCLFGREALTGFRPICFGKLRIPLHVLPPAI
ncbi:hypothetical protein P691DRAFT_788051 [Macrolepiota fuliginosa MF-IS2]|uniref:Uncharacterized protein n=1 Tax=Macrolepiota fuliginosa MF-IS2 TaxID=1400762 RepID=A0A9P5X5X8_9AGAR|nr:hypothetical protein P691DRAFT_788051 [Macrolepiota fuliginosa MF-IS2]